MIESATNRTNNTEQAKNPDTKVTAFPPLNLKS
jgi:hypothetical protein